MAAVADEVKVPQDWAIAEELANLPNGQFKLPDHVPAAMGTFRTAAAKLSAAILAKAKSFGKADMSNVDEALIAVQTAKDHACAALIAAYGPGAKSGKVDTADLQKIDAGDHSDVRKAAQEFQRVIFDTIRTDGIKANRPLVVSAIRHIVDALTSLDFARPEPAKSDDDEGEEEEDGEMVPEDDPQTAAE